MIENLIETVMTADKSLRIDKEAGVLHGVKIIGTESKNGRYYPNETLRKAVPLYENAKVNLDHPSGDPRKPRSYHDRFGVIRNVMLRENDGLFADFWFNPKHPVAEQLLWDAEHSPENVGFSHNVEAAVQHLSDSSGSGSGISHKTVVEQIVSVRSVDLVADPAATQGLFESCGQQTAEHEKSSPLLTAAEVESIIEERLRQFRNEKMPVCREQFVTETAFDVKAFAAGLK